MSGPIDDPRNLSIFSEIQPILMVADELPSFGKALREVMDKKWRFSYDGIENCPTEYAFYADKDTRKVACQYSDRVTINPDWYFLEDSKLKTNSARIGDLKQKQKDLFLHELFLGITLGKGVDEVGLAEVLKLLSRQPPPSPAELENILESSGFGIFGTQPCGKTWETVSTTTVNSLQSATNEIMDNIQQTGESSKYSDEPCSRNHLFSAGKPNFDSSCVFKDPKAFVNGEMTLLSSKGNMESTGLGFCKKQGFTSGQVVEDGTTESTKAMGAAILGSDGSLLDPDVKGFSHITVLICR